MKEDIKGFETYDSKERLIGKVESVHHLPDDSLIIEIRRNGDTIMLQESFIERIEKHAIHLSMTLDA